MPAFICSGVALAIWSRAEAGDRYSTMNLVISSPLSGRNFPSGPYLGQRDASRDGSVDLVRQHLRPDQLVRGPPSHQRHANPAAPQFRERVIDLAGDGIVHIIADLRGAGFLDSAGLRPVRGKPRF